GTPPADGRGAYKNVPQPTASSLSACKAARGLAYRCVYVRGGVSCGAAYWPRSRKWSPSSHGPRGAAGIKVSPHMGTTNDVQFHKYNCSTRFIPGNRWALWVHFYHTIKNYV